MIKTEKVPIQWRDERVPYCDNCGERLRYVGGELYFYGESSWKYECPACGLRVISPEPLEGLRMYNIIAIAGKAGSGKDTIMQKVLAAAPDRFHEIISYTSRPPREGEVDGKNYYFSKYNEKAGRHFVMGDFLEWTYFNDWIYATPKSSLVEDKVNIGVFNPAGLRSLSRSPQVSLAIVYITASDKIRLLRQLNREEDPDVKEIIRRFSTDEKDFEDFSKEFNYPTILLNEGAWNLANCVYAIIDEATRVFGQN